VVEVEIHLATVVLAYSTTVDDILLVANESLAISDVVIFQIDSVATGEIAVTDTIDERIDAVEAAYSIERVRELIFDWDNLTCREMIDVLESIVPERVLDARRICVKIL
jgi:hypothetical protein